MCFPPDLFYLMGIQDRLIENDSCNHDAQETEAASWRKRCFAKCPNGQASYSSVSNRALQAKKKKKKRRILPTETLGVCLTFHKKHADISYSSLNLTEAPKANAYKTANSSTTASDITLLMWINPFYVFSCSKTWPTPMSLYICKWNSHLDISQNMEHTKVLLPLDFQGQSWKSKETQHPGRDTTSEMQFSCLNWQYK